MATLWQDLAAVWGKGQQRIGGALHHVRDRLPMPLRELHTDNGGERLNRVVWPSWQRHGIQLTRGRPYQKNDQAYVEQRNGHRVRRPIGYDRYSRRLALAALAALYGPGRWHVNVFQPVRKCRGAQLCAPTAKERAPTAKERRGATVRRRDAAAQTPYQRVLAAGAVEPVIATKLPTLYASLNPLALQRQIAERLDALWALVAGGTGAARLDCCWPGR